MVLIDFSGRLSLTDIDFDSRLRVDRLASQLNTLSLTIPEPRGRFIWYWLDQITSLMECFPCYFRSWIFTLARAPQLAGFLTHLASLALCALSAHVEVIERHADVITSDIRNHNATPWRATPTSGHFTTSATRQSHCGHEESRNMII